MKRKYFLITVIVFILIIFSCDLLNLGPAAPSGLTAASDSSSVSLNWTDNSDDETGFKIERGETAAGPFTEIAETAEDVQIYSDTGLTSGTTYYYRICSFRWTGNSDYTAVVSATPSSGSSASVPSEPSSLSVSVQSYDTINLSWTDNSDDETGFKVYRRIAGEAEFSLPVTSLTAGTESYSDSGLNPRTTYYYKIAAYNSDGDASTSIESGTTPDDEAPILSAPSSTTDGSVDLSWTYSHWLSPLGGSQDRFQLWRSNSPTTGFSLIFETTAGGNQSSSGSYTDTLTTSGTYYYRVRSYNISSWSLYSDTLSVIYIEPSASYDELTPATDNLLMYSTAEPYLASTVYDDSSIGVGNNFIKGYTNENGFSFDDYLYARSLLKFNLPAAASGKTIIYAELRLYVNMAPASIVTPYHCGAVMFDYDPSDVTYNNAPAAYTDNDVTAAPQPNTFLPLTFDVTEIVQDWVDGTKDNYGFLLWDPEITFPATTSLRASQFHSMESSVVEKRPELYLEY